ncbi:MAG TPA: SDR family NAD(P)-dependent oxidoreductase [Chthoniobacterales bacterium]
MIATSIHQGTSVLINAPLRAKGRACIQSLQEQVDDFPRTGWRMDVTIQKKKGHNVVLVARSQPALDEVAHELQTQFKVRTAVIALDLAEPQAPERLLSAVEERGIRVRVLINNAGFGTYGKLHENSLEQNRRQISLNVSSLALLTQLFLPTMIVDGDGVIVNVASTAGLRKIKIQAFISSLSVRDQSPRPFSKCSAPKTPLQPAGWTLLKTRSRQLSAHLRKVEAMSLQAE